MAVAYTSPEALVVDAVAALLAASATFQALTGAADAAAARSSIVELDAGLGTAQALPYGLVGLPQLQRSARAGAGYVPISGSVELAVVYQPTAAATTPAEELREALNFQGIIAGELAAASEGHTGLPNAVVAPVADHPQRAPTTSAYRGAIRLAWRLDWYSPRV